MRAGLFDAGDSRWDELSDPCLHAHEVEWNPIRSW